MSVIKINAISVTDGNGPELEKRFASRTHTIEAESGFEGFKLLRPIKGEDRYFVITQWADEESFVAWRDGAAGPAHSREQKNPVSTGADLLEFEIVLEQKGYEG